MPGIIEYDEKKRLIKQLRLAAKHRECFCECLGHCLCECHCECLHNKPLKQCPPSTPPPSCPKVFPGLSRIR
jgi:hypothetical protein